MSVPGLFKTPWVKCISEALPRGVKDQVLSSLYSLLLSSFAVPRVSQFSPHLWIQRQSSSVERRAEHGCSLPQCTALSSTKPGHTKAWSEPLPFHASSRPGPRDRPFAASLKSAIPHMSAPLSWPSANQFTALAPPGFSQCQSASGQQACKINHIDLKQDKSAEALVDLPTHCAPGTTPQEAGMADAMLPFSQWRLEMVSLNCRQLISMKSKWGIAETHMPQPALIPRTWEPLHSLDVAPAVLTFINQIVKHCFQILCCASYLSGLVHCTSSYQWAHTANKCLPHLLAFWQSTTGHSYAISFS